MCDMLKRNKHEQFTEVNTRSHQLVNLSTSEEGDSITPPTKAQVSLLMAELGRKGGKVGGKRRLETMTPKERSAAAKHAAEARWSKTKK